MPRSLLAAATAAILVVPLLAATTVHAAEPTVSEVTAVAQAAGLECDPPFDPGGGGVHLSCASLELGVTYNASGGGSPGFATVSTYGDGSASSFVGFVTDVADLFCPGDTTSVPGAIVGGAGPQAAGSCELETDSDDFATSVTIRAATASPSAAAGDPPRQAGTWTYEGTWTLTDLVSDIDMSSEYAVGDTLPGTLTITCDELTAAFCAWEGERDGLEWWVLSLPQLEPGQLRRIEESRLENCPGGETQRVIHETTFGEDAATASVAQTTEPRTCGLSDGGTLYHTDETWTFIGALSEFIPADDGTPAAEATASPESSSAQAPGPTGSDGTDGAPGTPSSGLGFAESVPAVSEISTDPIVLLQSGLLAALLVFLMPFPSQLFNSTLETHEDEVRRWFRLDRVGRLGSGIGAFWASWPGVGVFTLLAALLYGFLDPGFGISLGSLATFVGMLLGIALVTAAFAVPVVLAHRRIGSGWSLKVVPVSLLIGVACVLLSRLTDFQPGYLYGLLVGLAFARELSAADEGRATALGAVAMLAVAFVSWLALGALPQSEAFGLVAARTTLAALMVAGLEGVVFGLLPMRFLPGESLYAWNRIAWGALLAIGAFAFFHILINPASGYLSDTSRTPLLTVLGLLIGFSLVSVAFWAWFRYRDEPPGAEPQGT